MLQHLTIGAQLAALNAVAKLADVVGWRGGGSLNYAAGLTNSVRFVYAQLVHIFVFFSTGLLQVKNGE
jgi:hypothetical protein